MTSLPGKNEGFRILDEFVCEAIPDASALAGEAARPAAGVGENEGMQIVAEGVSDSPDEPSQDKDSAADGKRQRKSVRAGKSCEEPS